MQGRMIVEERRACLLFRVTVVLGPLLAVGGIVYSVLAASSFPAEWQEALKLAGDGGILPIEEDQLTAGHAVVGLQFVAFALIALANQVALFLFWGPSRFIYLLLSLIGFAVLPLLGFVVQPPIEALLFNLSLFFSGMTLALAYFSPAATRFNKSGTDSAGVN